MSLTYKRISTKKSGELFIHTFTYNNFYEFRKLIYTTPQKFLMKDEQVLQFSNSKRVMPNGDICQIKEFNSMIQQFITLHIPQDIPEGTKYTFKAKGPSCQETYKEKKGLDATMVTCFNQFICFLYPDEELNETFIVKSLNPSDYNGCYIGREIHIDPKKNQIDLISPYSDKEIDKLLSQNK